MKIRPAGRGDLERLLELYDEPNALYSGVGEPGNEEARRLFDKVLADEHQETLVAEEYGVVVGTVVLALLPNLAHGGAPYAVVENVVVDEPRRGRGIGKALMRAAVEKAREAGAYKLALSANVARKGAHEFYRALGLKESHAGFEVAP